MHGVISLADTMSYDKKYFNLQYLIDFIKGHAPKPHIEYSMGFLYHY